MNRALNTADSALLLTEEQAATALSISVRTLQQWRISGRGPRFTKLGRAVRYRKMDLEAFVECGLAKSTTEADARKAVSK